MRATLLDLCTPPAPLQTVCAVEELSRAGRRNPIVRLAHILSSGHECSHSLCVHGVSSSLVNLEASHSLFVLCRSCIVRLPLLLAYHLSEVPLSEHWLSRLL